MNRNSIVTLDFLKSNACNPSKYQWAFVLFKKLFGQRARLGDVLDVLEYRMRKYPKRRSVYFMMSCGLCTITHYTGKEYFYDKYWTEWHYALWQNGEEITAHGGMPIDNDAINKRHRAKGWI